MQATEINVANQHLGRYFVEFIHPAVQRSVSNTLEVRISSRFSHDNIGSKADSAKDLNSNTFARHGPLDYQED